MTRCSCDIEHFFRWDVVATTCKVESILKEELRVLKEREGRREGGRRDEKRGREGGKKRNEGWREGWREEEGRKGRREGRREGGREMERGRADTLAEQVSLRTEC